MQSAFMYKVEGFTGFISGKESREVEGDGNFHPYHHKKYNFS